MALCNKKISAPGFCYLGILLILLYAFRMELLITSVRLWVTMINSPAGERILGDYYQSNANLSNTLSRAFYSDAIEQYKNKLTHASPKKQVLITLELGRFYQCGKGVPQNLTEAKQWYENALTVSNEMTKKGETVTTHLLQSIQRGLTEVGKESGSASALTSSVCHLQTDKELLANLYRF